MPEPLFHPEAQVEYVQALVWYFERSLRAAARFEAEVDRTLASISTNPEMFPRYDDEHRFTVLRRFPYSVVYQSLPDKLYVIAVAHSSRSPGYWWGRS